MYALQAASPVCIVHGPFGCGKSTLLVAVLHYLLAQRVKPEGPLRNCRVLVTAHTNVAVDRVISGLVDSGCTGLCCSTPYAVSFELSTCGRLCVTTLIVCVACYMAQNPLQLPSCATLIMF